MPSPSNLPLQFNRDRAARQLDARLEELLEKLRINRPSEDPWMVRRAYEIAAERHHDQFRSSGDPYLSHLLEVAHIVEGVTKISRLNMLAPETRQAENVRKMLLAMVNDVRVVLVKLADRL